MANKLSEKELDLIQKYEELYDADQVEFEMPTGQLLDDFMIEKIKSIYAKLQDKTFCTYCGHGATYATSIRQGTSTFCPVCKIEHMGMECDWWIVIVGPEGQGKSTFATDFLLEYTKIANKDFRQILNRNVAFDEFDMLRIIHKLDINAKFEFIWADEGSNVFFARDSSSTNRRYTMKFSNSMRFLRYVVVICAVEIEQLDTIIRNHRVKSLIHIQEQGIYQYFNYERMIRLLQANKGNRSSMFNWRSVEPNHIGRFGYSPETKQLVDNLKKKYMIRFKMEVEQEYQRALIKKLKEWIS